MSGKSLLIVGALALSSIGIASAAKGYEIVLDQNTMAGSTELKAGHYSVKVEGSQAVFTDKESFKTFKAPVTVANSDSKFSQTTLQTNDEGGKSSIREIDLGGSNTKLQFNR